MGHVLYDKNMIIAGHLAQAGAVDTEYQKALQTELLKRRKLEKRYYMLKYLGYCIVLMVPSVCLVILYILIG